MPTTVAQMVPLGMLERGSFKSPLSPSPAAMPVKAGNMKVKTSKNENRFTLSPDAVVNTSGMVARGLKLGLPGPLPRKNRTNAENNNTTTMYKAFTPRLAPLPTINTVSKAITPRLTHIGSMATPWATSAQCNKSRQATVNAMT